MLKFLFWIVLFALTGPVIAGTLFVALWLITYITSVE